MKGRFIALLILCFALTTMAFAQGSGGGTSQPANAAQGPSASSDVGKNASWNNLTRQGRSGDYLTGSVAVTGGALPWDPIPVNVICNGKARYTANTDPKGRFMIASKHAETYSTGGTADPHAQLATELVGCDVRASLAGFDSSSLRIINRSLMDDPDIGTITLTREQGSSGAAASATTQSAPKDAMKAFDRARSDWLDQKADAAQHDLEKAVKAYPQFAEAWYQLGRLQERNNSPDAWNSYSMAAAADPKFISPFERLAEIAARTAKWDDAVNNSAHVLELDPKGSPHIWYYNALGNFQLNKKDVAEASANKALAMDPLHTEPNTEQLLAVILAGKGQYADALQHLRNCLTYLPSGPGADTVKQQIAQLQKAVPGAQ